MILVIWFLGVYLIAGIPFGVIVSQLVAGKDVRAQGSGNIGATNVARMMGKKWGILVLILDALKGFLLVYLAGSLFEFNLVANWAACVAVLAHCYPVYLKFKGGKGVATALGVIAALSPTILGICFLVFAATLVLYRRVSAASLLAALALPVGAYLVPHRIYPFTGFFICAVIWWKHRENIQRIIKGIEPRFF